MNLPKWPPGANWRILRLFTLHTSTPGRFLAAYFISFDSSPNTIRGPFLITYLEFLYLPTPVLIFFDLLTLLSSSATPKLFKTFKRDFVVVYFNPSMTNGNSGILSTLWPLAKTRGVHAEAANADATACLLWVMLAF